jgi:hypothetical protein
MPDCASTGADKSDVAKTIVTVRFIAAYSFAMCAEWLLQLVCQLLRSGIRHAVAALQAKV